MKKSALFAGLIVCLFVFSSAFAAAEARMPIPGSKKLVSTFVISKSGSYYLAGNRLCDTNGIRVDANNVAIDLRGFSLIGNNTGTGIYMTDKSNVEISNGTVSNFNYGIYDYYGMNSNGASANHRVIGVRVLSNTQFGIRLYGPGSEVRDCLVSNNGTSASGTSIFGISVGYNSAITQNTVNNNGAFAQASALVFAISAGHSCKITENTVFFNGYTAGVGTSVSGIAAHSGSAITGNIVSNNGTSAGSVYGISSNGGGSTITQNTVYGNGSSATVLVRGISASSGDTVTGNTSYLNGQGSVTVDGIYAGIGSTVIGNTAYSNGASASGTVYGIYLSGQNFVNQNTAFGNGGTNMNDPGNCTFGENRAP
jgi:hypothetical protein